MTASIVVVGPACPSAFASWLDSADGARVDAVRGLGGSPVNNYVRALLEAGQAVELVTLAPELGQPTVYEGDRLRILAGPYRTRARDRARDLFRTERRHVSELVGRTDGAIVHANWTYEFALGSLASGGRVTLVTAQDAPFTMLRYQRNLYRSVRAVLGLATRMRVSTLVANSPYLASAWRHQMLYRRQIPVIPNVVWTPPTVCTPRSEDEQAPVILDVSDNGQRKNVGALVRAMPRVLGSHSRARLRLVGAGLEEGSALSVLATQLGIRDSIEFVGPVDADAVQAAYSGATLFVHPALEESFGMSVAEAMSHGLPVVASGRAGAVPWVLDEGRAGLLVDARRPAEIAHVICLALDDVPLRERLGAAARERVTSAFSPRAVVEASLQLYEEIQAASR